MRAFLFSMIGFLAACGSGDGDSGGGGTSGSGGTGGGAATMGVACGELLCTGSDACCISLQSETPVCAATCPAPSQPAKCDGPEDCGGNGCCGNISKGFSCNTAPGCETDATQLCHDAKDCSSGVQCIPFQTLGIDWALCNNG